MNPLIGDRLFQNIPRRVAEFRENRLRMSKNLWTEKKKLGNAYSEYKHVLDNISRSRYVAIATQSVHRLQIRPIVHN